MGEPPLRFYDIKPEERVRREIVSRRFCNSGNGTTAVTSNEFYRGNRTVACLEETPMNY